MEWHQTGCWILFPIDEFISWNPKYIQLKYRERWASWTDLNIPSPCMIEYNETWRQFLIIVLSQILKGQVQAKQ